MQQSVSVWDDLLVDLRAQVSNQGVEMQMPDWGESGTVDELESSFNDLGLEKSITSGLKVKSFNIGMDYQY